MTTTQPVWSPAVTPTGVEYDGRGGGDVALVFLPGWCGPRTLFEPLASRRSCSWTGRRSAPRRRSPARSHPWSSFERLDAASHFPTFEPPGAIGDRIRGFLGSR